MKRTIASLLIAALMLPVFASSVGAAGNDTEADRALFVLNRLTYGPRPGDVEAVEKMGVKAFIERELHPETIEMPKDVQEMVHSKDVLTMTPGQLFVKYGRPALAGAIKANANQSGEEAQQAKKDAQKLIGQTYRQLYQDTADGRIYRALYSPRQLEELMTEFWFNHFNVSIDKGLDHIWVGSYEEAAIRPFAMGKFRNLLGATAHHAAMLFYLDNWQNSAPGSGEELAQSQFAKFGGQGLRRFQAAGLNNQVQAKNRFKGLNENYARELMELHTLGVDGGYTQKDVIELAKILTGLGLARNGRGRANTSPMDSKYGDMFAVNRHDFSQKVLLGHVIEGTGAQEVEQALDILAVHPSTAHHISYQLAQFFLSDNPPASLVDKMSKKFLASDGDIKSVLSEMFYSPEFFDVRYRDAKFKSPYRYIVSSLRAIDASVSDSLPIIRFLKQQGMPLYQCLTPDGYKNTQEAWLNSDALLNRINFATAVGADRMKGIAMGDGIDEAAMLKIMGSNVSKTTVKAINSAPPQLKLSLALGSPEFMKY